MKKNGLWSLIRGELLYWFLILVLSGFFLYLTTIRASRNLLIATGVLNILLLETWFLRTFLLFSGRKISQYSEVIQRISLKDRFFDYFVLPAIFLSTFMIFLYYNKHILMSYWIIFVCMIVLLALFVNIKSSLKRVYRLSSITKGVFDLVSIITFYLSINLFLRLDLHIWLILFIIFILALLIFLSELQLHDRITVPSFLISIISALFVALSIGTSLFQSIFVATAIGTVSIYLIIALWNIRFSGKYKLLDYLPPFLYGVIAIILIFNL